MHLLRDVVDGDPTGFGGVKVAGHLQEQIHSQRYGTRSQTAIVACLWCGVARGNCRTLGIVLFQKTEIGLWVNITIGILQLNQS